VEFVDFCQHVGADPLMCVNFESDGRDFWAKDPKGSVRTAGPEEAAEWVSFCNRPTDALRSQYEIEQPCRIPLWQIGNETSYFGRVFGIDDPRERIEVAATKTVAFAKAMRGVDPTIELIGWGDSGWAPRMLEIAGEHLQYVAFHHMFDPDDGAADSPLQGVEYRKDPARTWEHLMNAARVHNERVERAREEIAAFSTPLALTECHFALPGRNRCEVLSTWAAGVANARMLNVHERHGDKLKIATLADFCGTRWQVNAVMIPVPDGQSFLMPVALVMCLYRHHTGTHAVDVIQTPGELDVTASRTANQVFLHVVNTNRTQSIRTALHVDGCEIESGQVFQLAADPELEVMGTTPEEIPLQEIAMTSTNQWTFPAASVSAVELQLKDAG
jgi:alpha-L-arabinofuranosidase